MHLSDYSYTKKQSQNAKRNLKQISFLQLLLNFALSHDNLTLCYELPQLVDLDFYFLTTKFRDSPHLSIFCSSMLQRAYLCQRYIAYHAIIGLPAG